MNRNDLLHELCACGERMTTPVRERIIADIGRPAWIKSGGIGRGFARFLPDGLFDFFAEDDFDGDAVFAMGVWSRHSVVEDFDMSRGGRQFLPDLYDLVAWDANDPTRWGTRLGAAWLGDLAWWPDSDLPPFGMFDLCSDGAAGLDAAGNLRLCATPLSWLQNGCAGSVLLDRQGRTWREIFEGGPPVVCDSPEHADRLRKKLKTPPKDRALPKIETASAFAEASAAKPRRKHVAEEAALGIFAGEDAP